MRLMLILSMEPCKLKLLTNGSWHKIEELWSSKEAHSLDLENSVPGGLETTSLNTIIWASRLPESWCTTLLVFHLPVLISAVSLATQMLSFAPVGIKLALSIHSLATITIFTRFHRSHICLITTRWLVLATLTWSETLCRPSWLSFHTTTLKWAWSRRVAVPSTDQCSSISQKIQMLTWTKLTTWCLEAAWRPRSRAQRMRLSQKLTTTSQMVSGVVFSTNLVAASLVHPSRDYHLESINTMLISRMAPSFLSRQTSLESPKR